jgi:hypothetical protein
MKISEITVTVGQTVQIQQYEPRTYSASVKVDVDDKDKVEEVLKYARDKANAEVKDYFSSLKDQSKTNNKTKELNFTLQPEILSHPNIPKPLHGINPRTIMGQKWWDKTRKEVYASTDYHCIACGVHKDDAKGKKWLEAHEYWDVDYKKGTATVSKIVPLCHYCHNFIHTGRLSMIIDKEKSKQEAIDILEHGFAILRDNKLKCFPVTLELAKEIGAKRFGVKAYSHPETKVDWGGWKLIFNGKEYYSQFKDYDEWEAHYSKLNKEN